MGKIGDLFVKLSLKKNEFDNGMNEAKGKTTKFGDAVKNISKTAVAGFTAIAAAVTAVIGALKEIVGQNQALGDAWGETVSRMQAVWETFKDSIASWNFDGLIDKMRDAQNEARKLYEAQDAMGEINDAYTIASSEQLKTMSELKVQLQDATRSEEERLAAGEKLLEIYRQLSSMRIKGLSDVAKTTLDTYMVQMGEDAAWVGLEEEQKKFVDFIKWLGSDLGGSMLSDVTAMTKGGIFNGFRKAWSQDEIVSYLSKDLADNNLPEKYATWLYKYVKVISDKDRAAIANAVSEYQTAEAQNSIETQGIQRQMNSLKNLSSKNNSGSKDKVPYTEDVTAALQEEAQAMQDVEDAEWELLNSQILQQVHDKDLESLLEMGAAVEQYVSKFEWAQDRARDSARQTQEALDSINETLNSSAIDAAVASYSESFQYLADSMMGLEDFDAGQLASVMIEPFANMAIQMGEYLMSYGAGLIAVKKGFQSMNPYIMLASGAALIALGSLAKASIKSLASGGGSSSSSGGTTTSSSVSSGMDVKNELTVYVKGTIKGSDIVIAGNNTLNKWSR